MECNGENLILQFFFFLVEKNKIWLFLTVFLFHPILFSFLFNLFWNISKKIIYMS